MELEKNIQQHVNELAGRIGPRMSGTPGSREAQAYIAAQMRACGLQVEEQEFAVPAWRCEQIELEANGLRLTALPNTFTPSCDVSAPLVAVSTPAELEAADLTGRIALLYGDLCRAPLACKSWFLKDERDEKVIALLEQKAPLAVLTVQPIPGSINRIIEDWEFGLPSATLPAESGRIILGQNPLPEVRLRIQTVQEAGGTANVVGRKPGRRPETLVLCAHYDTKPDTPGALDNAAGVAALLGLAGELAGREPDCGLEFIAFSNEELLPIGDDEYDRRVRQGHYESLLLAINFDGLGYALDSTTLAIYASSAEFQAKVEELSRAFPGVVWVEPWPESNHSSFAMRGVPALAFSGRAAWKLAHQLEDEPHLVSPAKVSEAVRLAEQIARMVQSQPLDWLRAAG